jgi:hypothetical protein
MFDWARRWIARQIVAKRGLLPQARLQWEVQLLLNGDEAGSRRLIENVTWPESAAMFAAEILRDTLGRLAAVLNRPGGQRMPLVETRRPL